MVAWVPNLETLAHSLGEVAAVWYAKRLGGDVSKAKAHYGYVTLPTQLSYFCILCNMVLIILEHNSISDSPKGSACFEWR